MANVEPHRFDIALGPRESTTLFPPGASRLTCVAGSVSVCSLELGTRTLGVGEGVDLPFVDPVELRALDGSARASLRTFLPAGPHWSNRRAH